jgi:LmbE family N-acetylglucosaminyl deacetylase
MTRRRPVPDTGTLLGIWAHPDDEAFLSAGLMATARAAGRRVVVVTATRGEAGPAVPGVPGPEAMAALRQAEAERSLTVLGVREHQWLGHRDGELLGVPREEALDQVVALLETVCPETIVTFGPDGMTGHADHQTVSSWVTEAWHRTGRGQRLWYATHTPQFHRRWSGINDQLGVWYPDATPPVTHRAELAASVRCEGPLADLKHAALRAHASQIDGLVAALGEHRLRRWWSVESFVAAT